MSHIFVSYFFFLVVLQLKLLLSLGPFNFYIWYKVWIRVYFFAYGYPMVSASFVEKIIFDPLSKSVDYFRVYFCLIGLFVYLSILSSIPHCFDSYIFAASLKVKQCQSFNLVLLQYCIGYSAALASTCKIQNQFFNIHKLLARILI